MEKTEKEAEDGPFKKQRVIGAATNNVFKDSQFCLFFVYFPSCLYSTNTVVCCGHHSSMYLFGAAIP